MQDHALVVPEVVYDQDGNAYIVTTIAKDAFCGNMEIQSVLLPATIGTIAEGAFDNCSNLETITIKKIGRQRIVL